MQNEKIAVIALVIIIAGALSVYFLTTNQENIFDNLFPPTGDNGTNGDYTEGTVIAEGDCVDIQYIGRYATNNTVFDSSYTDVESMIKGDPLRVYVTLNESDSPPMGYQANYSTSIIEGLMEQLVGLEINNTYTLEIPDEKAYGEKKLTVGVTFNTSSFAINSINPSLSLNQTLKVTKLSDTIAALEWVNIDELGMFTMPQIIIGNLSGTSQEDMITIPPPYFIWENSSEIQSIGEKYVTVKTTPTKLEGLTDTIEQINYGFGQDEIYMLFPDATTVTYDENTITLFSDPETGAVYNYELNYFGQVMSLTYTVEEKTDHMLNISITYEGSNESQSMNVNKTLSFDRTYQMKKIYDNIPMMYLESLIQADIEREGYSLHELAGEDLIFEVTIEKIIKCSQTES